MKKIGILLSLLLSTFAAIYASDTEYLNRDGWTWSSSSICAPEGDIAGLEGIYDGSSATCWHSNWRAESGSPERSNPHWVMIDRGTDATPFYGISYLPRQSQLNTHSSSYMVYFRDEDMSGTPATSVDDIISYLGQPELSGSWEQSYNEKFATMRTASTARYILFVNAASYSSSSAACAEFNLLANKQAVTGVPNAVKITPADGSEPHRIAIDGTNLSISMAGSSIHMSNSGITIEYTPEEVSYFSFEEYAFDEGVYYVGTKTDIYDSPFDLVVTPAAGDITELTEITINAAVGALPSVNTSATGNVTLHRNSLIRRTITPSRMPDLATEAGYVISGLTETEIAAYTLKIPEGFFIDAAGGRSKELTVVWNLIEVPAVETHFDLQVTPAAGTITELNEFTITAASGEVPTVNPAATENVTINRNDILHQTISPASMPDYATLSGYVVTGLTETEQADYTLCIPEGFFLDASGKLNNELTVVWNVVPEFDAINKVEPDCPTITLSRNGDNLIVGGITLTRYVTLTNTAGITVVKAPVSGNGVAIIPLNSLSRGVYLLNANNKTIKLTL